MEVNLKNRSYFHKIKHLFFLTLLSTISESSDTKYQTPNGYIILDSTKDT